MLYRTGRAEHHRLDVGISQRLDWRDEWSHCRRVRGTPSTLLIIPPLVSWSLRHCMRGTAADSNPLVGRLINEARTPTEPAARRDV